ncbi:hypothetical protein GCM10028793_42380 [Nocardiopsis oceani]
MTGRDTARRYRSGGVAGIGRQADAVARPKAETVQTSTTRPPFPIAANLPS